MKKEDKFEGAIGYPHTGRGDSGSPLWTQTTNTQKHSEEESDPKFDEESIISEDEKRHTIVAVNSRGNSYETLWKYRNNYNAVLKCSQQATKLTKDIIQWIKKMNKNQF